MEGAILGILALMVVVGIVGALLSSLIDVCDRSGRGTNEK